MKVLVIGQGGREHALVYALSQSPSIHQIHAIPGSDGMTREALCHSLDVKNHESIIEFCLQTQIDYVFIGPEEPLADGLSDSLRDRGILVVGPSRAAALLEASKIFSKEFMQQADIPTSPFTVVDSVEKTLEKANQFTPPYVLKADGLAAGKGVFICKDLYELRQAAENLFDQKILGSAGSKALLEQFMPGWEMSFLIFTNGEKFECLPLVQDHKRLLDQDEGPNTGGMGTVAPLHIDEVLRKTIEQKIVTPTIELLRQKHLLYRGVLFLGLMITDKGPMLLEYNCRFGDPETQVILPLIDGDIGQIFKDLSIGKLSTIKHKHMFASCVVMAAPGYPMNPQKNIQIKGDPLDSTASSYFLHAGTRKDQNGQWLTNGGRVLNSIGLGSSLQEAVTNAYEQAKKVTWMGIQKRSDIGQRQL